MPSNGWYYRLSEFFKNKFGEKVYKVPLHAGFTCPNRDGKISRNGCIFCYNPGFSPPVHNLAVKGRETAISQQIRAYQFKLEYKNLYRSPGKMPRKKTDEIFIDFSEAEEFLPVRKYIAYFQSYSNTYAPLPKLRELYAEALSVPGVIGLSIATRPDCLDETTLDLLEELATQYHIWLELGLQSSHNRTLELINRGHSYEDFTEAVNNSFARGINVCAHIINGLPGESGAEMLQTAERISKLPLNGIKFHQLQVVRHTFLEELFLEKKLKLLELEEYLEIICNQLKILRKNIVIHRLLGEVFDKNLLVAPHWEIFRGTFSQMVENELKRQKSYQGIKS